MKMDTLNFKKCMTKEEVALLVDLVTNMSVITSKETNAATNKLKDEAWSTLTSEFNCKSTYIPRTIIQLKLKWDNLKKAARKRSQQIRKINLKNGGSKSEYIPPDEILDKVLSLLGPSTGENGTTVDEDPPLTHSTEAKKRKTEDLTASQHDQALAKPSQTSTDKEKDTGVKQRNLAIARYYEKKTEKIDLEIQLLKSQLSSSRSCNSPLPTTPIRWDDDDED